MLEDTDSGQLEDIDVIPNEEILLVVHYQCTLDFQKEKKEYVNCLCSEMFVIHFQALSEKGYLKRMRPDTFNLQNRGTIGKSVGKLRVNDTMSDFLVCRTHDYVLYFRYLLQHCPCSTRFF